MLSLLLLFALGLAAAAALGVPQEPSSLRFDVRDALLIGAVSVGAWAATGAELLSLDRRFAAGPVLAWWLIAVLGLLAWVWRRPPDREALRVRVPRDRLVRVLVTIGAMLLLVTGLVAVLTPPNTWDCISYHLPRQMYWIQNQSVAHYPAVDLRQLEMPPLAEFVGAQLMLLSGSDHQANLVQWFSYAIGALAASAVARDLGAGARGQALAGFLTLVNPAAATQAENAKNDLVVALWALSLAWIAARIWVSKRCGLKEAAFVGAALGLLLLTKGTGFLAALPLCAVVGAGAIRARGIRSVRWGLAMILVAAALNGPHWVRNQHAFGSPLALPVARGGHDLANTKHSPAALASNVIRNVTLHTNTPWRGINAWEERVVMRAHRRLGLTTNDPATTMSGSPWFVVDTTWYRDGSNGSPLHLLLVFVVGGSLILGARRLVARPAWPLYFAPFVALIAFCWLLKWQPWHARLQIPLLALVAPLAGAVLDTRWRAIIGCVALGLLQTVPALLHNEAKPLVGPESIVGQSRHEILFRTQADVSESSVAAVKLLADLHPRIVAIGIPGYRCEYNMMRLVLDKLRPAPALHALRPNFPPGVPQPTAMPDAALVLSNRAAVPLQVAGTDEPLVHLTSAGLFHIYIPASRLFEARRSAPYPEFFGWDHEQGLAPAEGPYPKFDLPLVRLAAAARTTLEFTVDGSPCTLVAEARRNDREDQVMTILLNGRIIHQVSFGPLFAFVPISVPLRPDPGQNTLTFEFANINEPGPKRSVLFRRLQILPEQPAPTAP